MLRVAHHRSENQRLHSRDQALFSDFAVFITRILCSVLTFSFYWLVVSFLPGAGGWQAPEGLPDAGDRTGRRLEMGTEPFERELIGSEPLLQDVSPPCFGDVFRVDCV